MDKIEKSEERKKFLKGFILFLFVIILLIQLYSSVTDTSRVWVDILDDYSKIERIEINNFRDEPTILTEGDPEFSLVYDKFSSFVYNSTAKPNKEQLKLEYEISFFKEEDILFSQKIYKLSESYPLDEANWVTEISGNRYIAEIDGPFFALRFNDIYISLQVKEEDIFREIFKK
ncbi:hypothetical protein PRVXH_000671 [Proteinivorax hydrogeniformans]|uniref:DUF4367 domain-containing protein n=1 Tax=Proteinivorax hydrogeniformans TaxID=1826727 RepID=A0AAU8HVF1_9FIRM